MTLPIVRHVAGLRAALADLRGNANRIALVPTMGALHRGHLSLITLARQHADHVVASVFINPKQFDDPSDFAAYPRNEAEDAAMLGDAGTDLIYAPRVEAMYPDGFATRVQVPPLAHDLEGAHRPGHFDGVATVVAKLLIQSGADTAVFGEKDYQQLLLIRRMVRDMALPCRILGAPVVREADGLAFSSRNARLSPDHRRIAPALYEILAGLAERAAAGAALGSLAAQGQARLRQAGFEAVDYLCFRDAETLSPIDRVERSARLLATARLGTIRLLDNVPVAP